MDEAQQTIFISTARAVSIVVLEHGLSQMLNTIVRISVDPIWLVALFQASFLRVYPIASNTIATKFSSVRMTHFVCVETCATIASLILS